MKAVDLFRKMPAEDYHADRALGSSGLKELLRSPAHFKARILDRVPDPNPPAAFRLGTLVHEAVLEPELWEKRVVAPKFDRRTKVGKADSAAFAARVEAEGLELVEAKERELVLRMRDAVLEHRLAGTLFASCQHREGSLFWEEGGVELKSRVDASDAKTLIVDLKTTQDASPEGFVKSVANFGYHLQAAHYSAGYAEVSGTVPEFVFVAVEKTAPFAVGVYTLDPEALELGEELRQEALDRFRACCDSGLWPGYADERAQVLSLPGWAARRVA